MKNKIIKLFDDDLDKKSDENKISKGYLDDLFKENTVTIATELQGLISAQMANYLIPKLMERAWEVLLQNARSS